MSMIHYAFPKYVDFVLSTPQALASTSIGELQYVINKASFGRSASLGKIAKPLKKIHDRLQKHICAESSLLNICWDDITVMNERMNEE